MKVRLFFEGAGIAILAFIAAVWIFLLPDHLVIYHNPRPLSTIAGALALDLFLVTILFFAVFILLDRLGPARTSIAWAAIAAWALTRLVNITIFFLNYYDAENVPGRKQKSLLQLAGFGGVFLLWWLGREKFQAFVRAVRTGLALLGCCIVWMLPQLSLLALHTPAREISTFTNPNITAAPPSSERIVWILFDELSYDQVFDHRQPDVPLPHFNQLRDVSVAFANVQPAGYFTDIIVPSLFLGRELNGIRSSIEGDLYVRAAQTKHWEPFNPQATVFYNARQSGWSTGVAGWFNPYCRILSSVLDWCYWESINPFEHGLSDQKSTLANAMSFFKDVGISRITGPASAQRSAREVHAQEYRNVLSAATALIRNDAVRFAFVHLPVPHPPGIYDRHTHTFSEGGTYLDNLVLADQALGTLLDALAKTADASHTILIVSSDHSWRVGMWKMNNVTWTEEEERATGGKFDSRPVLLVHFPGENNGETKQQPFPEIRERALIDALLQGNLRSQNDLDQWSAPK
jgi:hypothetical protein